jgi:hypothetical protein
VLVKNSHAWKSDSTVAPESRRASIVKAPSATNRAYAGAVLDAPLPMRYGRAYQRVLGNRGRSLVIVHRGGRVLHPETLRPPHSDSYRVPV